MPDTTRRNHPGISEPYGQVITAGPAVKVHGWTLRHCAQHCTCHGELVLISGSDGSLGLSKYWPCDCCEPWLWHELLSYLKDLATITAIPTNEGMTA